MAGMALLDWARQPPPVSSDANEADAVRWLGEARKARKISQERLAAHMRERGFTAWRQTTVSKTESGQRPMLLGEWVALRDVLGE